MSKWVNTVKFFYGDGVNGQWNIERVRLAVTANPPWITAEEFEQITGQTYVAQEAS